MKKFTIEADWFPGTYEGLQGDKNEFEFFGKVLEENECPRELNDELHEAIIDSIFGEGKDIILFRSRNGEWKIANDDIEDVALQYGLTTKETDKGLAITGLDNFDQALEIADKTGLRICEFERVDGERLWRYKGETAEPLKITAEDYGDEFELLDDDEWRSSKYFDKWWDDLRDRFPEMEFPDAVEAMKNAEEIYDELDSFDPDTENLVLCGGKYYDTVGKESMEWSYDTHNYVIGLMKS